MLGILGRRHTWRELARMAADEDHDEAALALLTRAVVAAIERGPLPEGCIRRVWRAARQAGYSLSDVL